MVTLRIPIVIVATLLAHKGIVIIQAANNATARGNTGEVFCIDHSSGQHFLLGLCLSLAASAMSTDVVASC